METSAPKRLRAVDLVYIALMAAVIAVCAWLSIPAVVPFTMQTFGVFCAIGLLGGRRGTLCILLYLLLGAIGLPVFSGFRGGFQILIGATGGFLVGFLFCAPIYALITARFSEKLPSRAAAYLLCQLVLYAFGTGWFLVVGGKGSLAAALLQCVVPFLLPDLVKLALALWCVKRIKPFLHLDPPQRA